MEASDSLSIVPAWNRAGGAGVAALPATKLFADSDRTLSKGDAALLRLAAAAEFIEADLWQQYNELGGAVDHNDNPNPGKVAPLSDPGTGLTFNDFNNHANQHNSGLSAADQQAGSQMFQTNLILPEPCQFLSPSLPACSIIRPTLSANGGPTAAITGFVNDGLFIGQPQAFSEQLMDLASEAEAARRLGDL